MRREWRVEKRKERIGKKGNSLVLPEVIGKTQKVWTETEQICSSEEEFAD